MLFKNPNLRISVQDALKHSFFLNNGLMTQKEKDRLEKIHQSHKIKNQMEQIR